MTRDIHVDHTPTHIRKVSIYDRMGSGAIALTEEEAEYVRDRLDEILDDADD